MNWYYVENGQQAGPVDEAALADLVRSGKIQPSTLVWHEGMPDWKPYAEATGADAGTGAPPAEPPLAGGQGGVICAECGKAFSPSEVIRYQDKWICAACKPTFFQRLREGGGIAGSRSYGQVTEDELIARDYDVDIGHCVSQAWELFKANAGIMIGATFLISLTLAALNLIPFVKFVLVLLLTGPLAGGLWFFFIKHVRSQPATVGDAFSGFGPRFVQLLLVHLIPGLISLGFGLLLLAVLVIAFPAFRQIQHASYLESVSAPVVMTLVGLLSVFFLAMVYLNTCWMFALPLVADKNLAFWPALRLSWKVVQKHWWMTFFLAVVAGLISVLGAVLCGVGVILSRPLGPAILAVHYEKVFGDLAGNQE